MMAAAAVSDWIMAVIIMGGLVVITWLICQTVLAYHDKKTEAPTKGRW